MVIVRITRTNQRFVLLRFIVEMSPSKHSERDNGTIGSPGKQRMTQLFFPKSVELVFSARWHECSYPGYFE